MITRLDLNSDMGERETLEGMTLDGELMPFVTSVNIACGGHAGSRELMRRTAALAARHGVAIGAHPGLPDRAAFGRAETHLSSSQIETLVSEQLAALGAVLSEAQLTFRHVKPHGSLYNMAARDSSVAQAVITAVKRKDAALVLYALAGSVLARLGRQHGLAVVEEAFVDRAYRSDGSLLPRTEANALLEGEEEVRSRLHQLLAGCVTTVEGAHIPIRAGTLCLHSDTPRAVSLARMIRRELDEAHVIVAPAHHA
ncbi:MAG TPA: 5-oxoprolinase subunit PxpA [Nitrospira sp.]|nr:5-oxoprolinase subunit PxpA [Nitrospira sp.]